MGIYPDYADSVAFYAVGVDPSEDLEFKESYRQQEGHPWPVADPVGSMLRDLKIWGWLPEEIAFNAQGVIIYGYTQGDPRTWQQVFQDLVASRQE